MFRKFTALLPVLMVCALVGMACARETLMNCSAVRAMSPEDATKFSEVDLLETVICRMDGAEQSFVLQDDTGFIFVELAEKDEDETGALLRDLEPGTVMEMWGYTVMGDHGPRVKCRKIRKERVQGLPAPAVLEAVDLTDGKHEDRYVEFNAVVRTIKLDKMVAPPN